MMQHQTVDVSDLVELSWARPPGDTRPVGWWDCKRCGADSNPPLGDYCLRCHSVRPGCEKTADPKKKIPDSTVRETLIKFLSIAVSASTLIGIVSIFVPALRPFVTLVKTITALLQSLLKGI